MPRELQLTPRDHAWLDAMDRAMQPVAMVSMDSYCAAINSADYITRQNYILRRQRARLIGKARKAQSRRRLVRRLATGVFTVAVVLLVELVSEVCR